MDFIDIKPNILIPWKTWGGECTAAGVCLLYLHGFHSRDRDGYMGARPKRALNIDAKLRRRENPDALADIAINFVLRVVSPTASPFA